METTINEYYVSLEVTKLLAEVGFDWECKTYYDTSLYRDEIIIEDELRDYNFMNGSIIFSAPTLGVVQRWLREKKNIDVVVLRAMQWKQFYYTIEHEENRTSKIDFMSLNEDMWWFKYEEALESGIKKALEIILEKGE